MTFRIQLKQLVLIAVSFVLVSPLMGQRNEKSGVEKVPEFKSLDQARPGKTALLKSVAGMDYFIRLPKSHDADKGARLILFMHGSNRSGLTYLRSFEAMKWCDDDIMLCPNDEAAGDDPYGANNLGFASANPVSALTKEVPEAFNITRTYIGGHSQGGFVTYSVIMHFPDLYQGAFPIAGDCWLQNEPNFWEDDAEKSTKQKLIPIAIIHGQDDPVVSFFAGQTCQPLFHGVLLTPTPVLCTQWAQPPVYAVAGRRSPGMAGRHEWSRPGEVHGVGAKMDQGKTMGLGLSGSAGRGAKSDS